MNLTDDQCWLIACAPDDVSTASLARVLGASYSTVNNARWRFRREGWTCGVAYVRCEYCGEGLTNDLPANARRRYHPACKAPGLRHVLRMGHVRRWQEMDAERRAQIGERGTRYQIDAQEATLSDAVNRRALWTAEEDAYVLTRMATDSTLTIATALGRTYHSVRSRRATLRRKGILD